MSPTLVAGSRFVAVIPTVVKTIAAQFPRNASMIRAQEFRPRETFFKFIS